MGSASLYHLARRGVKALGIEQFQLNHELGSSHGVNRIIRLAYREDPAYVPLLHRSYELWRELEKQSSERLLYVTGGIDVGLPDSPTVEGALLSCLTHNLSHEVLDAASLEKRFPGCRFPRDLIAVYQPDAGFLLAEGAVRAHLKAAESLGAEVHFRERVLQWEARAGEGLVQTDHDRYSAENLVIAAGPWIRSLVPSLFNVAKPERQVLLWSQPLRPEFFAPEVFPVFILDVPEGLLYGTPIFEIPGFKIGRYHHLHQQADPDRMDRECHPEDEKLLRDVIRRYFPDADGPTLTLKTCIFTNSPDGHFIIDHHPESPRVLIAAGFSGHGFKFCGVVGETIADFVLNGGTQKDIHLFRLARFSQ
ncbi:MAG: N-methyl-L-tryptophan oxidase [Deltaproteobacteria bacterium]|nr:N-methyl-L-tryptophan oxidase [Deltaproteobacteria bacterium]